MSLFVVFAMCGKEQVSRLLMPSAELSAAESISERIVTQTNWLSSTVTWWYFGILGPHSALPCTPSAPGSCGLWPFTPFFIAGIERDRLHGFHHRTCQHVCFHPRLLRKLKQNINTANSLRGTLKDVSESRGGRKKGGFFWSKNPELECQVSSKTSIKSQRAMFHSIVTQTLSQLYPPASQRAADALAVISSTHGPLSRQLFQERFNLHLRGFVKLVKRKQDTY